MFEEDTVNSSSLNFPGVGQKQDPANQQQEKRTGEGQGGALLVNPQGVFVAGNYAYVASYGSSALEIVDVANPASPFHKGSLIDGGSGAPFLDSPYGVYVSGNNAYVASYSSNALEIVDVTNPAVQQEFYPRHFSFPQNAVNPQTGNTSLSRSTRVLWGNRHCPLRLFASAAYFVSNQMEFSRAKK
jgi:hypothetical protein